MEPVSQVRHSHLQLLHETPASPPGVRNSPVSMHRHAAGVVTRHPGRRSVHPRAPGLAAFSPLPSTGSARRKPPARAGDGGVPGARGVCATVPPRKARSHLALRHG